MKRLLILRKKTTEFVSIEKVFSVLRPYLNIQKVELPFKSKGFLRRMFNLFYILKYRKQLVHLSGHEHYLLALPFFKKSILTIHDLEGLYRLKGWRRWLFKKFWFDWPIHNAKVITTVSKFTQSEIKNLIKTPKTVHYIPNPLTLALEYDIRAFNNKKPTILQIGTKENKNIYRLIAALKGINCKLVVVGKETIALKQALLDFDVDYTIKNNLSNEAMIETYKSCDMLAFVSTYEGFGLPILEAQAVGRVVLTASVASMSEVAGEGALLVDPYSVEEIRKGVLQLIGDKVLRENLIQKGLENVGRFEAETIAKQYL